MTGLDLQRIKGDPLQLSPQLGKHRSKCDFCMLIDFAASNVAIVVAMIELGCEETDRPSWTANLCIQ
jgi:hypothetical protein